MNSKVNDMNERTNHTTGATGAIDDDFESLARGAGAELRRPAPAGGADAIRAVRRRQQRTRTLVAATGVAATLAIALAAGAVLRGDDQPAVVVQPTAPSTPTMPSSVPTPTSTPSEPEPTPPPTVATPVTAPPSTTAEPLPLGAEVDAWIAARLADGFTTVEVRDSPGTTARLLVAQTGDPAQAMSAVLLDDGRVVATPQEMTTAPAALYGLGGLAAVVDTGPDFLGDSVRVWQYDPESDAWAATGDLGVGPVENGSFGGFTIVVVDDRLIVANNQYVDQGDGRQVLSSDQRGVVVHPDLTVTEMAPAPDGVPLFFTSSSGGKALQMYGPAIEGGIELDVSYDQPWQYDPVADEWSEIPIPEWIDCATEVAQTFGCDWAIVPDIGSLMLDVATDRGVVARVPDGTVGLYDAATSTWTRLDDAPFELWMPTTAVVGDQVVVAPWDAGSNDFTLIGVLDVATGSWTTHHVDIPADVASRFNEWFDVSWDLRVVGSRVLAAPGPSFRQSPIDPIVAYDTGTRTWTAPTADDLVAWPSLTTVFLQDGV